MYLYRHINSKMKHSHQNNFKNNLIQRFPKVELSYERILHKKVSQFDTIMAIPKGPKCYLWITKHNGINISIYIILDHYKKIKDIFYYYFDKYMETELTNNIGTILYGTLFYTSIHKCFTVENIMYHCGNNIERNTWGQKWLLIDSLFENHLHRISDPKIIVGLPILSHQESDFKQQVAKAIYPIYKIEYRNYYERNKSINTKLSVLSQSLETNCNEKVFLVKPTLQNDIYNLYDNNNFIDIAHIPDYTTSVMMNSLFRNIKENANLDALEESDDEEEFQNEDEEQYVCMDRSYKMKCKYNYKFKKWQPIEKLIQ